MIRAELSDALVTGTGKFRSYAKTTAWRAVATSTAEAQRLNAEAKLRYEACCDAVGPLRERAAEALLAMLVDEIRPLVAEFQSAKRSAAALDFDDLLYAARDLLRRDDAVRVKLAGRFSRILVDEFQDTDPIQPEIFQRLTSDPPASDPRAPLDRWTMRPGALFLVGDPQQAIYRFRGANVATYVKARDAMRAIKPDAVLSIGVNFRSTRSIIDWVNRSSSARFRRTVSPVSGSSRISISTKGRAPSSPRSTCPRARALRPSAMPRRKPSPTSACG